MIKNWKYLKADGLISRKATTLSSCNLGFGKLERKEETETKKNWKINTRRLTEWRMVLELDLVAMLQKTHDPVAPIIPAIAHKHTIPLLLLPLLCNYSPYYCYNQNFTFTVECTFSDSLFWMNVYSLCYKSDIFFMQWI